MLARLSASRDHAYEELSIRKAAQGTSSPRAKMQFP
jgi:hypothetical protein